MPKDGPSAGIAMATAIVSLLRAAGPARRRHDRRSHAARQGPADRRPAREGGGRDPRRRAHLIIPKDNEGEYLELPHLVRKRLVVHLAETMDEVLAIALLPDREAACLPVS